MSAKKVPSSLNLNDYFKTVTENGVSKLVCTPCLDHDPDNACRFTLNQLVSAHDNPTLFLQDLETPVLNDIAMTAMQILRSRSNAGDTAAIVPSQILAAHPSSPAKPSAIEIKSIDSTGSSASSQTVYRSKTSYHFNRDFRQDFATIYSNNPQAKLTYTGLYEIQVANFKSAVQANRAKDQPSSRDDISSAYEIVKPLITTIRSPYRFAVASAFISYFAKDLNDFYGGASQDDRTGLKRLVNEYHKMADKKVIETPTIKISYLKKSHICDY